MYDREFDWNGKGKNELISSNKVLILGQDFSQALGKPC